MQRACDGRGRIIESVRGKEGDLISVHLPQRTAANELVSMRVPIAGCPDLLASMRAQQERQAPAASPPSSERRRSARERSAGKRAGRTPPRRASVAPTKSAKHTRLAQLPPLQVLADPMPSKPLLDTLIAADARVYLSTAQSGSTFCVVDSERDNSGLLVVDVSGAMAAAQQGAHVQRELIGRTAFAAERLPQDDGCAA